MDESARNHREDKWIHERFISLDQRFSELKETVRQQGQNSQEAVRRAEAATDKRFDAVNEFRAQLQDQAAAFLTKSEYNAGHTPLVEKVDKLSQPQWTLLFSMISIGILAIGGFWTVLGLKIDSAINPENVAIESMRGGVSQNTATMQEFSRRLRSVEEIVAASNAQRQAADAELSGKLDVIRADLVSRTERNATTLIEHTKELDRLNRATFGRHDELVK